MTDNTVEFSIDSFEFMGETHQFYKCNLNVDLDFDFDQEEWGEHVGTFLAILCAKEILFVIDDTLFVNVNDMFAWAMADLEEIKLSEVPDLFKEWFKDQHWGDLKWVAKKRNLQPQEPVIAMIKKEGLWDDEWEALDFGEYNRYMVDRRNKKKAEQTNE